jgi:hypothetical protein
VPFLTHRDPTRPVSKGRERGREGGREEGRRKEGRKKDGWIICL